MSIVIPRAISIRHVSVFQSVPNMPDIRHSPAIFMMFYIEYREGPAKIRQYLVQFGTVWTVQTRMITFDRISILQA